MLANYFLVAGTPPGLCPERLPPHHEPDEAPPVTDLAIVTGSEVPPPGFTKLACSPGGTPADLNGHGGKRAWFSKTLYLCVKRDPEKLPLVDIKVVKTDVNGAVRFPPGYALLQFTAAGDLANLNMESSGATMFFTYKRATGPPDPTEINHLLPPIDDVVVIFPSKGESPPAGYKTLNFNLNEGNGTTSVFLALRRLAPTGIGDVPYKPHMLDRYPMRDYEHVAMPPGIQNFCMPRGVQVCRSDALPFPTWFPFVLTEGTGRRVYGCTFRFFDPLDAEATAQLMRSRLPPPPPRTPPPGAKRRVALQGGHAKTAMYLAGGGGGGGRGGGGGGGGGAPPPPPPPPSRPHSDSGGLGECLGPTQPTKGGVQGGSDDELSAELLASGVKLYASKAICVLSYYPYFNAWKQFLSTLYRISVSPYSKRTMERPPLEAYIEHFMRRVPLPGPGDATLVDWFGRTSGGGQVIADISFYRPQINKLPLAELSFLPMFLCLDVDNIVTLFTLMLLEYVCVWSVECGGEGAMMGDGAVWCSC